MVLVSDPIWKLKMPTVHESVVHMLIEAAAKHPDREALVCGDERLTYREFLRCVGGFAQELTGGDETGLAGQRVALVMGSSIDICIAYFAAHAARAQAVPLDPASTGRDLGEILEDAEPSLLLYDESVRDLVEPAAEPLGIAKTIMIGPAGRRLTAWRELATFAHFLPAPNPTDLATLHYGAAAGRANGINLTHSAIATNLAQRDALLPARHTETDAEAERILCVMPLFHIYPLSMCLYTAVHCAGTLVILPQYDPAETLAALARERVTVLAGNPSLLAGLMAHETFGGADWSALRVCCSGSSALPKEVLKAWEKATGATVLEGYGQSEAGPILTFNPLEARRKAGSVGIPLPLTEIEIVDLEAGSEPVTAGKPGEIRARGPQVMTGYRNRPDETAATLRDGWLHTGDVGTFDKDGYLYIRGPKADMITVSGHALFPREIEDVLYKHRAVREAAVVGLPDGGRGVTVKAFVALKPGGGATEDDLLAHCRKTLAKYKVPAELVLVAELPVTPMGKIDKERLTA